MEDSEPAPVSLVVPGSGGGGNDLVCGGGALGMLGDLSELLGLSGLEPLDLERVARMPRQQHQTVNQQNVGDLEDHREDLRETITGHSKSNRALSLCTVNGNGEQALLTDKFKSGDKISRGSDFSYEYDDEDYFVKAYERYKDKGCAKKHATLVKDPACENRTAPKPHHMPQTNFITSETKSEPLLLTSIGNNERSDVSVCSSLSTSTGSKVDDSQQSQRDSSLLDPGAGVIDIKNNREEENIHDFNGEFVAQAQQGPLVRFSHNEGGNAAGKLIPSVHIPRDHSGEGVCASEQHASTMQFTKDCQRQGALRTGHHHHGSLSQISQEFLSHGTHVPVLQESSVQYPQDHRSQSIHTGMQPRLHLEPSQGSWSHQIPALHVDKESQNVMAQFPPEPQIRALHLDSSVPERSLEHYQAIRGPSHTPSFHGHMQKPASAQGNFSGGDAAELYHNSSCLPSFHMQEMNYMLGPGRADVGEIPSKFTASQDRDAAERGEENLMVPQGYHDAASSGDNGWPLCDPDDQGQTVLQQQQQDANKVSFQNKGTSNSALDPNLEKALLLSTQEEQCRASAPVQGSSTVDELEKALHLSVLAAKTEQLRQLEVEKEFAQVLEMSKRDKEGQLKGNVDEGDHDLVRALKLSEEEEIHGRSEEDDVVKALKLSLVEPKQPWVAWATAPEQIHSAREFNCSAISPLSKFT